MCVCVKCRPDRVVKALLKPGHADMLRCGSCSGGFPLLRPMLLAETPSDLLARAAAVVTA